jgi:DNA-binding XRE family transcriptional regulator
MATTAAKRWTTIKKRADVPRRKLRWARETLRLTTEAAAALIGCNRCTVERMEAGGSIGRVDSRDRLRRLCREYAKLARREGLEVELFHEAVLCPGEFELPKVKA